MKPSYSLVELIKYFLKLGTVGFGGPVALVAYMQRDLVDKKKWISIDDYKEGLALSQLAPGPLAAQLAIYIGYVHYRYLGATLVGLAFIIPSFLMVLIISYFYVNYGGLPWMQAVFYGVGAAVIGIISISSYKMTKKSIGTDYLFWAIYLVLAVSTFLTEQENLFFILLAGFVVLFWKHPNIFSKTKSFILTIPLLILSTGNQFVSNKLVDIGWFFTKAGAFVFGSGLAIVPFLYGGVVKEYHWLTEQQFLDAVAVAMITPGPVVITVAFIGFLVAGLPGACVAAIATFLPCYLFTILPAPYFKKYGKNPKIKAFVDGVTVAAIGAIVGAVLVLAKRQLVDFTSFLICFASISILLLFKKIQEPIIILIFAVIGVLLSII
jgi:chromate transporter